MKTDIKTTRHVGLIGLGYWGKNILRNLVRMDVLHTACDENLDVLASWKKTYPDVRIVESYHSALETDDIAAVAIATPAATHFSLVREALLSGKDVFVEKPLALNVSDAEELVRLAEERKRVLMVGHILQFHPAVIKLKRMISEGDLGKIEYIYSNRLNIGKLRTEENILWSFAPHDISAILMLMEEEPVQVSTFGGAYLNNDIYDITMTTLAFNNCVRAHIFVSWLHPFKEQKLVVVGSNAMAVFDDVSREKLSVYPHKIQWRNGKIPVACKADFKPVEVEDAEPLRAELDHFLECVRTRRKPKTDGKEAVRVLKVIAASEKELSRKNPVSSPPPSVRNGYYVHESACVDPYADIGRGTRIWNFSDILEGSTIGKNCVIGQNVKIGPDVSIGNGCKIQNNVSIFKGVRLEDDVFCGPSCVFTNVYNPRAFIERKNEFMPTIIKRGATIGANATIVCGATIGKYAMIGAGAVVKSDVPDYAMVAGVPARPIGWVCRCGCRLTIDQHQMSVCGYCGDAYREADVGIEFLRSG